jgi:hypothetical protein
MPDIQTALKSALSKTLQEWDDDAYEGVTTPAPSLVQPVSTSISKPSQNTQGNPMTTQLFPIKNNISRATFNHVRDNPGSSRKEIMATLDQQGFSPASTSSLLSQMVKNKMIHVHNEGYYADIPEYVPIKTKKPSKKKGLKPAVAPVKTKRKYERKDATGIGALLKEKLEAVPAPSSDAMDAAAYAMGGIAIPPKRLATIVRYQDPDEIIKNLTVFQARELHDRLKQIFGA